MVLPPHDAAVAGAGVTYGEMRATMNAEVKSPASSRPPPAVALGCSSGVGAAADYGLAELHLRYSLNQPRAPRHRPMCWHR